MGIVAFWLLAVAANAVVLVVVASNSAMVTRIVYLQK
jgi:hypothetical protein